MAADYQLPLTDVNRVRFYDGQFLQDQDFVDEQKHHVGRQNRHHRTLHVAGVAEGLTLWGLKSSPEPEISVTKGMAIDADGRQIILGVRTKMESARWPEGDWSDCWLYIAYHQEPDPNSLPNTTIGVEEETRWLETPYIFTHVGDSPLGIDDSYDGPDWSAYLQSSDGPPPPVLLAKITRAAGGALTADDSVRQYSGLRLPGPSSAAPALRTDSNGNVGLWMVHNSNEIQRLTVTSDGALGIATTALPRQTLDVNGRIYVNNGVIQRGGGAITSTSDLGLYSQYGGHWMRFVTNAAPFRFFTDSGTGGTARFSIEEDGKVGIGHIDVAAQLDIKGQANTENQISLQLRSGNGSQNFDSNQITLGYNNTDTYRHAVKTRHSSGSQSGNAIDFYTWKYLAADNKDDATDIGTLHTMSLAGGSVGIGTTAPSQKLEVNGLIKAQSLMLGTWPAGANNAFVGGTSDTFDHADSKNYALLQNTTGDATPGRTYLNSPVSISFRLNNDDKMFLDEAGNFGIGTTDINEKLEVAGAIRATSGLYMDKKSTSNLSSAGWHRIASGKGNTSGIFEIRWNAAGRHGHVRFAVSVQYGDDNGAQLKIIDQSSYQGKIVSEIRLLLHNTNDTHFVEFYFNGATYDNRALPFNIFKLSGFGWALVEPTPGQVPSGYANHRIRSDVLFATRAAKSGSYFVIDNSTNVGIGHNSPEEKLHVNGRIKAPPLVIGAWPGQAAGDYAFFGGTSGNFDHTNGENYALLQYTGTSANPGRTYLNSPVDIRFRLKNADKMILDTDGNFGIGTTDPKAALDVNGRILRKGQAFSHAGIADHNASVSVPWGTRADWNIFVSPNSMGAIEAGSEGDNALLVIECTTSAPNTTQWKIHARYWFRFREGSGEWKSGKANYIMIPK